MVVEIMESHAGRARLTAENEEAVAHRLRVSAPAFGPSDEGQHHAELSIGAQRDSISVATDSELGGAIAFAPSGGSSTPSVARRVT